MDGTAEEVDEAIKTVANVNAYDSLSITKTQQLQAFQINSL
jgi:hypothetical protein